MKLVGITGTGTGKLGSSVFAVNSGVQIVRQYQPVVSNPSTEAQVEQRAKLKLASQLARDLKKSIAIPKDGLVTSRNKFMSRNFPLISYANNTAEVALDSVQLTDSSLAFPAVTATAGADTTDLRINAANWVKGSYEKIAIEIYNRNSDGTLSHIMSDVQNGSDMDTLNLVEVSVPAGTVTDNTVIYVYGFNLLSDKAKATYANLSVNEGASTASLLASRIATSGDVEVSRTQSVKISVV